MREVPTAGRERVEAVPHQGGGEGLRLAKKRETYVFATYLSIEPVARHLRSRPTGGLCEIQNRLYTAPTYTEVRGKPPLGTSDKPHRFGARRKLPNLQSS